MRLETGVRTQILSFVRQPLNVALAVIIPLLVVEGFGKAMASIPETSTMQAVPGDVGMILGAAFSTAFLAGILGLFQAISAHEADRRLVLTGYPAVTLLLARLVTILLVSAVVAAASYAVLLTNLSPEKPVLAFGFLMLGGVVYALVGVVTGAIIPREFEGSLLVVFVANMDAFLGSSMSKVDTSLPEFFPLYYPRQLFQSAVIDGSYSGDNLLSAGLYVAVLLVLTVAFFVRAMDAGEGFA